MNCSVMLIPLILELLDLANAYFETQLKRRCVQMIKQGITVQNAAFLYKTAIEYNAKVSKDNLSFYIQIYCSVILG